MRSRERKNSGLVAKIIVEVQDELIKYRNCELENISANKEIVGRYNFSEKTLRKYLKSGLSPEDYRQRQKLIRSRKGPLNHMFGKKASAEARKKMSESRSGEKNYWYGKKIPEEFRRKMSEAKKGKYRGPENPFWGKTHSVETRARLSKAIKQAWSEGEHPFLGRQHKEETKTLLREIKLGKPMSAETRLRMSSGRLGKPLSTSHRASIANSKKGEKNPNWAGGKSPLNQKLRTIPEYKAWRLAVFRRDDYTCRLCFQRGGYLEADHYPIAFAQIINEIIKDVGMERLIETAMRHAVLWDIDNGRTLCKKCHRLKS